MDNCRVPHGRSKTVRRGWLLDPGDTRFRDGYQAANRLFIVEQPSAYYRRHLLLHEGVHWFMASLNGGGGPAWYMEGMAEWISTHRWIDQRLQITAIPSRSDEVPYWGRVKRIQEDLRAGKAPSIESIMRVSSSAHKESEGYSWSWAAVLFFQNHPEFILRLRKFRSARWTIRKS